MLNWKRFFQFNTVPPAQAALALGVISLGQALGTLCTCSR